MYPNLGGQKVISLDTETDGIDWNKCDMFGFSISTSNNDYYYDIRKDPKSIKWLRDSLKKYNGLIINHNIKFDAHILRKHGIDLIDHNLRCTLVRAALIDENRMLYNLDDVAMDCMGVGKEEPYQELADMFGGKPTRNAQMKNLYLAPFELVNKYAKTDSRLAYDLWKWQEKEIYTPDKHGNSLVKISNLEDEVLKVIIDMESFGVRVDIDRAERSMYDLGRIIDKGKEELNKIAGFNVNPNPSSSIHELFKPKWDEKLGSWVLSDGTLTGSTDAGKASIGAETLMRMRHPAAKMILNLRKLSKCMGTFIEKHILEHNINGRVYPNINQVKGDDGGTRTGRLSYTGPALQQFPSRDEEISAITRVLFIPEEGDRWYRADYSQADARAFVHYTQSPPLLAAYKVDKFTDFHGLTAKLTGLPRNASYSGGANSKQLGLGLIFSMGEGTMASEMGLPYSVEIDKRGREWTRPGPEAQEIFERFHKAVPGVKEFSKQATSVARSRGYVISLMGRRLRFPGGQFAYKAAGYLYQSATAEFNKVKMVDTWNLIRNTGTRLLLSVHDELNYSSNCPDTMERVKEEMEDFSSEKAKIKLRIPMVAEMGSGANWYEAK